MAEDGRRVVALPSGRQADIRKGKGRDLMRAHRAVAGNPEPMSVSFALIAEVARIEGNRSGRETKVGFGRLESLFQRPRPAFG